MVKKIYEVVWIPEALTALKDIFEFIKKDSPPAAIKVKQKIILKAKSLKKQPQLHSIEHYLALSKGDFRFVLVYSYKVIFEIAESRVVILDIFHTSRNPVEIPKVKKK